MCRLQQAIHADAVRYSFRATNRVQPSVLGVAANVVSTWARWQFSHLGATLKLSITGKPQREQHFLNRDSLIERQPPSACDRI
jgi:hypothetical protein